MNGNIDLHAPVFLEAQEKLFRKFMEGRLRNGEPLKESVLAQEFGVNRRAMREALCQAVGWGIVEYVSFCGFRIRDFTLGDLLDLEELRDGCESVAARKLAQTGSAEAIARLEHIISEAERAADAGDHVRFASLDMAFHLELLRSSGNDKFRSPAILCYVLVLLKICGSSFALRNYQSAFHLCKNIDGAGNSPETMLPWSEKRGCEEHGAIFQAIRDGNAAEAERLAHAHVGVQLKMLGRMTELFGRGARLSEFSGPGKRESRKQSSVFSYLDTAAPIMIDSEFPNHQNED